MSDNISEINLQNNTDEIKETNTEEINTDQLELEENKDNISELINDVEPVIEKRKRGRPRKEETSKLVPKSKPATPVPKPVSKPKPVPKPKPVTTPVTTPEENPLQNINMNDLTRMLANHLAQEKRQIRQNKIESWGGFFK